MLFVGCVELSQAMRMKVVQQSLCQCRCLMVRIHNLQTITMEVVEIEGSDDQPSDDQPSDDQPPHEFHNMGIRQAIGNDMELAVMWGSNLVRRQ